VQVLVRDNNVDQALKVLKKKMQREGVFREMKLRDHYEKPSEKKGKGKGGSGPPRPQACAQEIAARGPVADEAEADHRSRRRWRPRQIRPAAHAPLRLEARIDPVMTTARAGSPALLFYGLGIIVLDGHARGCHEASHDKSENRPVQMQARCRAFRRIRPRRLQHARQCAD